MALRVPPETLNLADMKTYMVSESAVAGPYDRKEEVLGTAVGSSRVRIEPSPVGFCGEIPHALRRSLRQRRAGLTVLLPKRRDRIIGSETFSCLKTQLLLDSGKGD
jgi:hypothetical protein